MTAQLRKWISAPTFEDEVRNSRAHLINILSLSVLFLATLIPPAIFLFTDAEFTLQLVLGRLVPIVLLMITVRMLLYRRRVEVAGIVLVIFIALILSFNAITTSGVTSPSYFGLMVVIMFAGAFINDRAVIIATVVSLLIGITLMLIQVSNPEMFSPLTTVDYWVTGSAGFVVFGVVLYLLVRDLGVALSKVRASNKALLESQDLLEDRVTARTRDLAIAAEIGQTISKTRNLDRLLAETVRLIQQGFELYHVQIYLTDEIERNLVIHAASGHVGQRLTAQHHSLPLATNSINTAAANKKQSVLVMDTLESRLFRPNPLLPDTRAELAVPLLIGQQVLGVLNLQSNVRHGITESELPAFETLGGQLAGAIENARLFSEVTQARAKLEEQSRQFMLAGWREYMDGINRPEVIGRTFQNGQVLPIDQAETALARATVPNAVNAPITVSGLTIGAIQVEPDEERGLTSDEEVLIDAVARQVAQQVENLRLLGLAETYQRTAEDAVRRLTREAWEEQLVKTQPAYQYDGNQVKEWDTAESSPPAGFIVPISIRDETVGDIAVGNTSQNPAAAEITTTIAERLSAHIENLRLAQQREVALRQTELRSEELAAINRVANAVSRQLEFSQLLETIYESVNQVMQAEVFIVTTYDPEIHKMRYPFVYDNGQRYDVTPLEPGPSSLGYQVIQNGEPLLKLHTAEELAELNADTQQSLATIGSNKIPASTIFVPLTIGSLTVGAMSVQSYQLDAYDEQDMALMAGLGNHVAVALDNARLFNEAQRRADRERLVNEISQKIQDTNTVEAALQAAIHELGRAFNARQTRVELSTPATVDSGVKMQPTNGQTQQTKPVNGSGDRS